MDIVGGDNRDIQIPGDFCQLLRTSSLLRSSALQFNVQALREEIDQVSQITPGPFCLTRTNQLIQVALAAASQTQETLSILSKLGEG